MDPGLSVGRLPASPSKGMEWVQLLVQNSLRGQGVGTKGEGNLHLNADTGFSPGTEESFSIKMLMKEHIATPNPQPPRPHLPIGLYSIADQSLPSPSLLPQHTSFPWGPSILLFQLRVLWAESEKSAEGADYLLKANEIGGRSGDGELELWNHQTDLSCATFQL